MELAEEKAVLEQVHADVDAVAGLIKENKKLSGIRVTELQHWIHSC